MRVQRVHFSLATTIEYRTVFLSWFALLPLLQANGLGRLVPVLDLPLPASLLLGSLLVAMTNDGLGIMSVKETYFSAVVGVGLALAYWIVVALALPGMRSMAMAVTGTAPRRSSTKASRTKRRARTPVQRKRDTIV